MARKKKRKSRKSKTLKKANLPAAAQSYLAKGNFAEAIKIIRKLHKEDSSGRWDSLFTQAFLGRIDQLSAKKMWKEALVIFDNMLQIFPTPDTCLQIRLLLGAGLFQQAVKATVEAASTLTKKEKAVIDELLASLLLSGRKQLQDVLPKDSPICVHYSIAERALQAYCRQDDNEVHAALRAIPFRSPYRNFSLALKGMLLFDEKRSASLPFFDKIPPDSPFISLTTPYRWLASGDDRQGRLTGTALQVANTLEGTNSKTSSLLDSLNKEGMTSSALYRTFVNKGNCLGQKQLRKICYRILPHVPGKLIDFQKRFGKLSTFERARIEALTVELDGDCYNLEAAWKNVCDIFLAVGDSSSERLLRLALIYRHIAELMEKDSFGYDSKDIEKMLTKSLEFDSRDKETWLKLVDLRHLNLAKRYKLINSMLEVFPEDNEIMTIGVEAAIKRGAFKKASRLAGKLLAVDSINPKVRIMLIDAHLAHARKVAAQQKYTLAFRECELAASFERQNLSQGRILIYQGLLSILSGDKTGGMKILERVRENAANLLLSSFDIRLEAGLLSMSPGLLKGFTTQLKNAAKLPCEKPVILQLFEKISACNGDKHMELEKFRSILTPCLKKGAHTGFSLDELKRICSILYCRHYHDLLGVYAKISSKKHTGNPLFLFYQIYAKSNGGKKRLSSRQFNDLEDAWDMALDMDDQATANLIDTFLVENSSFMGPMGMGGNPMEVIGKMFGGALAEKLESGGMLTEEEVDRMVDDIIDTDPIDNEQEKPVKKKSAKKINPKQLKLFP